MKNEFLFEKNRGPGTHFGKLGNTESRKNLKENKQNESLCKVNFLDRI